MCVCVIVVEGACNGECKQSNRYDYVTHALPSRREFSAARKANPPQHFHGCTIVEAFLADDEVLSEAEAGMA